ncbi:MAG: fold metallo-hydrolase [Thermoleophilia bacterium]|nr:fold metallo-hydrolase [Thermoleophilia bacterium]
MRRTAPSTLPVVSLPQEVQPGIWVLPIPLHVRSQPVNSWLLEDVDHTLLVFDTGIDAGAAELWPRALASIGYAPHDVRRIVVSHHHPDHVGGSGALHHLTGAPILASRETIRFSPLVWGDDGRMEQYFAELRDLLALHGFPVEVAFQLEHEAELAKRAVQLPPDDAWQAIDAGDVLVIGGRSWRVIPTPGHVDGQIALHDAESGLLLAADHLLERVSPAVGRFPRHEPDPLASYLASLDRVASLEVGTVLPGHGMPFTGASARARALQEHHAERVEQCVAAVDAGEAGGGVTAYEVARSVFAHVFDRTPLDAANQRFATTESLAHLEYARGRGRLAVSPDASGHLRYVATGA